MSEAQEKWEIGLSSWIIQDGNYGDFETGMVAEFALEVFSEDYRTSGGRVKSCKRLNAAEYEVQAEIVYVTDGLLVVDCGVCAFQRCRSLQKGSIGGFVEARVHLGIDPFDYFERLCMLPKIPPLIYSWKVDSIARVYLESSEPPVQELRVQGERRLGYETINRTNAWKDDNGNAEYVPNVLAFTGSPDV